MIHEVVEKWQHHMRGQLEGGLDGLLDSDVVFYSPIVFSPQRGKEITKLYLSAAMSDFPGDSAAASDGEQEKSAGSFRYTKQTFADDSAILEFETTIDETYVNGVDIIKCNEAGKIIEFRVMIRPLQAVNLVHQRMGQMLELMDRPSS